VGLIVTDGLAWCVCRFVCLSVCQWRHRAKTSRPRYRLLCGLGLAQGSTY